ncbi:Hypothetical protein D9617_1g083530 [Elsinoe fawcettii]|nr:Hypothetical protein D9617_1g083530 [Elsinoe fawcettii]
METLSKEQANELLKALLTNLRNTLATFGPDSPQTASVKETVRAFLLSMQIYGIETDLSKASLASTVPAKAIRQDGAAFPAQSAQGQAQLDMLVERQGNAMDVDPKEAVNSVIERLMAGMKL